MSTHEAAEARCSLIARDTMHQEQWLAVIEELGGLKAVMPIPNSVPKEHEATEFSYVFLNTLTDKPAPEGRWTSGPSLDLAGTPHELIWQHPKSC